MTPTTTGRTTGRNRYATLLVVALLITTAGCGVLEEGSEREPYGIDEPIDISPIDGVNETGVYDAIGITQQHAAALENTALVLTEERRVSHNGELTSHSEKIWTITPGGQPAAGLEHQQYSTTNETTDHWIDERGQFSRIENEGENESAFDVDEWTTEKRPEFEFSFSSILGAVDTVTNTDDELVLEGEEHAVGVIHDASVRVVVSEHGYISEYRIEGEHAFGQRVEYTGTIEPVGSVELEEPEWVTEANQETE